MRRKREDGKEEDLGMEVEIDRLPLHLLAHIFAFITCFKDLAQ